MAAYLELIDRETGEVVKFAEVDNIMCAALGYAADVQAWHANWYNCLGMSLACGITWEQLRVDWADTPGILEVINYLERVYIVYYYRSR